MLVPRVGDDVYVETSLFIEHGWDDRCGGLATVTWVGDMWGKTCIRVKEFPSTTYSWPFLYKQQEKLQKRFGSRRAHPCPEGSPCPYGAVV